MNTKSLLTRIAVPVLGLGLLGGLGATLATSASASTLATTVSAVTPSPLSVSAVTHENGVFDTTSFPSDYDTAPSALKVDPNFGPYWAYDNLSRHVTATQDPAAGLNMWKVTVESIGSYSAFADPQAGLAFTGTAAFRQRPELQDHGRRQQLPLHLQVPRRALQPVRRIATEPGGPPGSVMPGGRAHS